MGFRSEVKVRDLNERKDLGVFENLEMTLPPHSAKLLRVEGRRADQTKYEAEWAYVEDFSMITAKRNTRYVKEQIGIVTTEGLSNVNFKVRLKKGSNAITIGNPTVVIPIVDAIEVFPM